MVVSNTMVIYCGILTFEKVGNSVNCHCIFIKLVQGVKKYFGNLTLEKEVLE
jgi:hypothetical protein